MSTLPPVPSAPTTIPLPPDVKAAYQHLSDTYEAAIETTTNDAFRIEVFAWRTDVENILTKDRMYQFNANTALLKALQMQISSTNRNLVTIKGQIAAVASHIATAGEIIAAINKVLSLVPAA